MNTNSRRLTVVLATAGLLACGGNATETSADGGTEDPDGGGGTGGAGAGGSPGTGGTGGIAGYGGVAGVGGTGGTSATGGTGGTDVSGMGGSSGGDPACDPISCPHYEDGTFLEPEAKLNLNGTSLQVTLTADPYEVSLVAPVEVTVDPALGTLSSATLDGSVVTIEIDLAPGTTGGEVIFDGTVRDTCSWGSGEQCDVHRKFIVDMADGGQPTIALALEPERALEMGPRIALKLLETGDAWARVVAEGALEGANIQFDATGGSIANHGNDAKWTLPRRPGFYQMDVVVQQGGVIATDALVLEVREVTDGLAARGGRRPT